MARHGQGKPQLSDTGGIAEPAGANQAVFRGRPQKPAGLHPETSRYTGTVVGAAAPALFAHEPQQENAMSRILKIAAALAVLASLGACTVLPPQVAYSGPSVGIAVGPAPYYAAPYYAAPAPYYARPAYGGYWRRGGYGYGHRHW
jgi:hypothetical protein